MNSYLLLILGYLLIFFSLLGFAYRFRKIELTKEDNYYWWQFQKKSAFWKDKISRFLDKSLKEISIILRNLLGKILLRIKIEALKLENWASKKLENLKEKNYDRG